jgi:hypothetical protein
MEAPLIVFIVLVVLGELDTANLSIRLNST